MHASRSLLAASVLPALAAACASGARSGARTADPLRDPVLLARAIHAVGEARFEKLGDGLPLAACSYRHFIAPFGLAGARIDEPAEPRPTLDGPVGAMPACEPVHRWAVPGAPVGRWAVADVRAGRGGELQVVAIAVGAMQSTREHYRLRVARDPADGAWRVSVIELRLDGPLPNYYLGP